MAEGLTLLSDQAGKARLRKSWPARRRLARVPERGADLDEREGALARARGKPGRSPKITLPIRLTVFSTMAAEALIADTSVYVPSTLAHMECAGLVHRMHIVQVPDSCTFCGPPQRKLDGGAASLRTAGRQSGSKSLARIANVEETKIDREAMGRLAKALAFIGSPDDRSSSPLGWRGDQHRPDIKQARMLFLKVRSSHRRAALASLIE